MLLEVIPYHWYRRIVPGRNGPYTNFDNRESINGMTFYHFPFTLHYSSPREVALALAAQDPNVEATPQTIERICGYAVVDAELINKLEKTWKYFNPGGDSASDAVSDFQVAYCVANAEQNVIFKMQLHNREAKTSEYVEMVGK